MSDGEGQAVVAAGLADLWVVELGSAPAGQYCAKLLAGLGATVVKVVAAATRERADEQHAGGPDEGRIQDLYLDAGKKVVRLDLDTYEDRESLRHLVDRANVVVDSRMHSDADQVTTSQLREWNPRLVIVGISWFGASGPHAEIRASELTCTATSGYMAMNGYADREPLKLYGIQGQCHAGLQAAIAALAALRTSEQTGYGCFLDVSIQESLVYLTAGAPLDYFHSGSVRKRSGNSQAASTRGQTYTSILRCADGYILLGMVGARDFARLEQLMGATLTTSDDHLREYPGAHEAEMNAICGDWLSTRQRERVLEDALACGMHWALISDLSDIVRSEQVQARGYLTSVDYDGTPALMPGRPIAFSRIAWATHGADS
jgi:crotonobetainyl-CoA:carnitine CoA-transferase CaiB-like acyl-CoA transferase